MNKASKTTLFSSTSYGDATLVEDPCAPPHIGHHQGLYQHYVALPH